MNTTSQKTALLLAAIIAVGQLAGAAETNTSTATTTAATPAKPLDIFANDIVARGKDVKVTRAMLDERVISFRSAASAQGRQIPPQQMKMVELRELSQLIGLQLLNKSATAEDKAKGEETAKKNLEILKENSGGEDRFALQLKAAGLTAEEVTKKLAGEATAETVLTREVKFEATDDDAKKFYDENPDQFERPEQVRAAHVLIGTREKDGPGDEMSDEKKKAQRKIAEDIVKRAKAGEDFAKLAKEHSDDPGSKDNGGEYTFPRGKMMAEFEASAFSLATNQVSDVVTTMYGYHVIKLYEKLPAKKIELAEVVGKVKEFLKRQGMTKLIPDYIAKLEKDAGVEILDADLKKLMDEAKAEQAAANAANAAETKKPEAKKPEAKK